MDSIVLRIGENIAGAFKAAAVSMEDYAESIKRVFPLNKKG